MASQGTVKRTETKEAGASREPAQPNDADVALLESKPDWDRMGEIADRLLSTPPDRQAVGKALAPKHKLRSQG